MTKDPTVSSTPQETKVALLDDGLVSLVFMPTVEHVGVSRKIVDDDERRRLKTILKELRQARGGGGLIARTVGSGHSKEDFERDLRYLARAWDEVRALGSRPPAPALLH